MFELVSLIISGLSALASMVSAAADGKTSFWGPRARNGTSSHDIKKACDELDMSIRRLRAQMKDYEEEVEQPEIKEQLENFEECITKVLELVHQVKKESEKSSSNYSEEMKKKLEEAIKLLEDGNKIKDQLMVDRPLKSIVKKKAPCIQKIQMFQEKLRDVLELLKNEKVRGIGISGVIGVGKTTIMLNLNNDDAVSESFDVVIWVDVSKACSDKNLHTTDLQCQILERLNKKSTEVAETNKSKISKTLKDKKYLLLLDDVKEHLELGEIGIPDGKEGSKVVLTTRHNEVCSLLVNRIVNVEHLPENDALEMFRGILEWEFDKTIENYYFAMGVVRDCHYIPILIEQIAKSIKLRITGDKSAFIWKIRFSLLHKQESKKPVEEYYNLLKEFYCEQMDDVHKKCFFFGALYPEGSDTYADHLMECLKALCLDGNGNNKKPFDVHKTLACLANLSLLEEGEEDHVTMEKTITM